LLLTIDNGQAIVTMELPLRCTFGALAAKLPYYRFP